MSTDSQRHPPVIPFSSENVAQLAKLAWGQVSLVAEGVSEPTIGRASGFYPSDLCFKAMSLAVEEYPGKASFSVQPRRISRSRKGGVVYFPGKPRIADTFTIMIPISIQGDVKLEGMEVSMDNYYHILQECTLDIPEGGKLVTLIVDNIVL
ncbi:hypothetical protein N7454_003247 [Penicillium verhagenii]|nr:hypothetical protein N7454_003247 [Penicillium verhagenii]